MSEDELVGQVADEFLDRVQHGERPDVEEYAQRYPSIADLLRDLLPPLLMMPAVEKNGPKVKNARAQEEEDKALFKKPLGDFRLIREIGRGGMGVVFEAEQLSLGRRVALKVLPFAAMLDQRQLARFRNEAQAAAHLHHTNIVPVFSVGCERGVHYYAMQYIDGQPLSAVIRQMQKLEHEHASEQHASEPDDVTPSLTESLQTGRWPRRAEEQSDPNEAQGAEPGSAGWSVSGASPPLASASSSRSPSAYFRNVAELGIQAAEAVHHGHEEGVVHRDIKPSNLILDGAGRLWVTDFGLASFQKSDVTLTLPGDVLGTLRYMSPEQALGNTGVVDYRADVYSLGVTLYELLTLRPAFTGTDRQKLLNQIAFEEPPSLRKLNPSIPVDLETIIGKAMAKEPADRYATAKELADDLRRFLAHQPIRARRPSMAQIATKWMMRHRGVVAVSLVASLFAIIGLTIALLIIADQKATTDSALQEARENAEAAIAERRRATAIAAVFQKQFGQDPARMDELNAMRAEHSSADSFGFQPSRWRREAVLFPDRRDNDEDLGDEIAAYGDTVVLGVWRDDVITLEGERLKDAGAVYIYSRIDASSSIDSREDWVLTQKLISPNPVAEAQFGRSVAMNKRRLIVGAYQENAGAPKAGAVYVYKTHGGSWTFSERIAPPDPVEDMHFGSRVELNDDTLAVGAYRANGIVERSGAVYLFELDDSVSSLSAKLSPEDLHPLDQFGFAIELSGQRLLVGAVHARINSRERQGSAYLYYHRDGIWTPQAKFLAYDGEARDRFGFDVGIDGDTVVIAAHSDDLREGSTEGYHGSAYVFKMNGTGEWVQHAKLVASVGGAQDTFGRTVAIRGDTIVLGAPGASLEHDQREGACYIFERSGDDWRETARLCGSNPFHEERLGGGLALMNDRIILGSRENSWRHQKFKTSAKETIYSFTRVEGKWEQKSTIQIPNPPIDGLAGFSVAITDRVAVIGGPGRGVDLDYPGSVQVFARHEGDRWSNGANKWLLNAELKASDGKPDDQFGRSVATDGRFLVVGSPYADYSDQADAGAVHVYKANGPLWQHVAKLTAPDAAAGDRFGISVSVSDGVIAVGADRRADTEESDSDGPISEVGAVYLYKLDKDGWSYSSRLDNPSGEGDAYFGHCVALSGGHLLVGCPREDDPYPNGGAAYLFHRSGDRWILQSHLLPSTNAAFEFGTSVSLDGDTAVVGSRYDGVDVLGSGLAYVFHRAGGEWVEQAVLASPKPVASSYFGACVHVRGDLLVIGESLRDTHTRQTGMAHVFQREGDQWRFVEPLWPIELNANDRFGHSVATDGRRVIVGAPFLDAVGENCGVAAIYSPRTD